MQEVIGSIPIFSTIAEAKLKLAAGETIFDILRKVLSSKVDRDFAAVTGSEIRFTT